MCGIIGFSGNTPAVPVLLSGLSRLEYRGYDSAGVAVYAKDTIQIRKAKGRLANLKALLQKNPAEGTCGIGHTRWATHGEPSDINAHPHISQQGNIAIVHNGIIENYLSLKEKLIKKGVCFVSDTDTEVAAQLLSYYYTGDIMSAIYKTLGQLKGSFALGILCTDYPNKIFCARKDSPLVVGALNGCSYIASDIPAILEYTRNVYLLEDMEVAVLEAGTVAFFDGLGNKIVKEAMHVDWDVKAAEKGGYQHFMMKEMHEQPTALKDTLSPYVEEKNGKNMLIHMPLPQEYVQNLKHISIVACGTAYHAGFLAKYLLERDCRIHTEAEVASEFRYKDPLIEKDDLVIIISQSGETADTIAAMREAKRRGARILAICNVVGSTISREADYLCYTWAGPEIAVASTKAYVSQLMMLYTLYLDIAQKRGILDAEAVSAAISQLKDLPGKVAELIQSLEPEIAKFAHANAGHKNVFFLGRGLDYALAMEASLKLKEISYIHSEAYAAGELKHGTIALIEEGTLVVAIATQAHLAEKTASNVTEVKVRGAKVLALLCGSNAILEKEADVLWHLPEIQPVFRPIAAILPLQMLAYYMALERGCDIDKPRNLAKSVTVE